MCSDTAFWQSNLSASKSFKPVWTCKTQWRLPSRTYIQRCHLNSIQENTNVAWPGLESHQLSPLMHGNVQYHINSLNILLFSLPLHDPQGSPSSDMTFWPPRITHLWSSLRFWPQIMWGEKKKKKKRSPDRRLKRGVWSAIQLKQESQWTVAVPLTSLFPAPSIQLKGQSVNCC